MAELIADIKLRWYDDSALLAEEPRELLELLLDSVGVTSDVARDMMEVLLMARAKDVSLTTAEVKSGIAQLRASRKSKRRDFGMTDRNIQVWLRYFEDIGLLDSVGGKHRFAANKTPSEAFKRTKEVIKESVKYTDKLLEKVEDAYGIR
ncbi:MAG: hypothetical protein GF416_07530 [Candidatus Altiarchaeales archaeon]|nr:hypothetical protein [Candidatus Altiarchaeales archaeon]MBD3416963.1 hypothetical protein [Candidatus Altiarchaeales archaeon]